MSSPTLPAYLPRSFAFASHFALQTLINIPCLFARQCHNAAIVEAFLGAIEKHYAAFVRAMQRARRRASLGSVMDELAWDVDMGGECWDLL